MKIIPKYRDFFIRCAAERHILIQGGRRSGKTIQILIWLRTLSKLRNQPITVLLVTASFPEQTLLINDFRTAFPELEISGSQTERTHCDDGNIKWLFKSFDRHTKSQGTNADYVLYNEALNIPMEVIKTINFGIRSQCYYCYNPTAKNHPIEDYRNESESNKLYTTYRDNPFLTPEQLGEFEDMIRKAKRKDATPLDRYAMECYVLGNYSSFSGKVFNKTYSCTMEEYRSVPSLEVFGLDYGFTEGGDATTLVGAKINRKTNELYLHLYIYDRNLTNDRTLAEKMYYECGLDRYSLILADYGGVGNTRNTTITSAGNGAWMDDPNICQFTVQSAVKPSISERIAMFLSFDRIYITETSETMAKEYSGYEYDERTQQPKDKNNHTIDAGAYATSYLKLYT